MLAPGYMEQKKGVKVGKRWGKRRQVFPQKYPLDTDVSGEQQLYKACIIGTWDENTEARQPQNKHFYSLKHGQTANINREKLVCKNGPKYEIMKQLTAADSKQVRALQQHWIGSQNKPIYRTEKTPKTNIDMAKLLCKKMGQKVAKEAVTPQTCP